MSMGFITGKHVPRRTFVRGMGATVALPFLDAMAPAGRFTKATPAAGQTRLIVMEEVHGLAGCSAYGESGFVGMSSRFGSTSVSPYADEEPA